MNKPRGEFSFGQRLAVVLALAAFLAAGSWGINRLLMRGRHGPQRDEEATIPVAAIPPLLTKPAELDRGYVGSQQCRDCHAEIWQRYQAHPMARSAAALPERVPLEGAGGAVEFSRAGRTYRAEFTDEGVTHHERVADESGGLVYDQAVNVSYAIGSGRRGRSYVIDRGGLLFMSSISWYSEKNRWDLSPGYDERAHQRFSRRLTGRCLSCHVGQTAFIAEQADRFQSPPIVELGIGCERCHGPGAGHVAFRQEHPGATSGDPIVNPARLPRARQISVCNQCHLLGADDVLLYGRGPFDFRPGMAVGDVWSIFVHLDAPSEGASRAVSQVEQMRASRCFRESAGRMTCTTCHDPHGVPPSAGAGDFYTRRCQSCHDERGCSLPAEAQIAPPANGSCIHCHMPRNAENDIPHVTQTNHRIPRVMRPPAAPESRTGQEGASRFEIFRSESAGIEGWALNRAQAIFLSRSLVRSRDAAVAAQIVQWLDPIHTRHPEDFAAAEGLARAFLALDMKDEARRTLEGLVASDRTNEDGLLLLIDLAEGSGQLDLALRLIDRLLKLNPWLGQIHGRKAQILEKQGRLRPALEAAQVALELDPSSLDAYDWLASVCQRLEQRDLSEEYRHKARLLRRAYDATGSTGK